MRMIVRNISEAKAELSALVEAVTRGDEVIIAKAGVPVAKITRYQGETAARKPGAMRGKIHISADFDALPDDVAIAFGVENSTKKRRR